MTLQEQKGLSISAFKPLVTLVPGSPNTVSVDLTRNPIGLFHPTTYSHNITATEGFVSASFQLDATQMTLEWLLNELLGAHIEVRDEANSIIWEGFANALDYAVGGTTFRFGPVNEIVNRVMLKYKRLYTGTNPPNVGASTNSPIYEVQTSQERWGIRYSIINAGERTEDDIAQCAYALLVLRAGPRPKTRHSTGSSESATLTVAALGYVSLLKQAPCYFESANEVDLSDKLAAILDAEPNGIINSANAVIEANAVQVPENEDTYRDAMTVISNLVQRGNAAYQRTIFMVEEGRRIRYQTAPTTIKYVLRNVRGQQRVSLGWSDTFIPEALVRAGEWLYLSGSLPNMKRSDSAALIDDPRALFIESVKFDLEGGLELDGAGDDNMVSRLDKFELGTEAH